MGIIGGPGAGGGSSGYNVGVWTGRHGYPYNTWEGATTRSAYHLARYKMTGLYTAYARARYWSNATDFLHKNSASDWEKATKWAFFALPGKGGTKGKPGGSGAQASAARLGLRIVNTKAGKTVLKTIRSPKTQKQLENAMGIKSKIDAGIKKSNPLRKTKSYKAARPSKKAAMDALWVTGVWGAARIAWTTGGTKVTQKILGKKSFTRRRRYS